MILSYINFDGYNNLMRFYLNSNSLRIDASQVALVTTI